MRDKQTVHSSRKSIVSFAWRDLVESILEWPKFSSSHPLPWNALTTHFLTEIHFSLFPSFLRGSEEGKGDMGAKMASSTLLTHCLVFFFFIGTAVSAPFISARIFEAESKSQPQEFIGRSLLQAKDDCKINFEFLNYTVLTSECKGPQYLPKLCCPAFKKFACPAVDELNDMKSTCATTMFSYINLYGKYPPGLFSSECVEAARGLDCKGYVGIQGEDESAGSISQIIPSYLILAVASLVLLFQMI